MKICRFMEIFVQLTKLFLYRLRHEGEVKKVFSYNGVVNVKKTNNDDKSIKIYSTDDLYYYFPGLDD